MTENELTVFDIKFNEAIERLDSLFSLDEETNSSSIKSYIERYRLDKSLENKILKIKITKKIKVMKKESKQQIYMKFAIMKRKQSNIIIKII